MYCNMNELRLLLGCDGPNAPQQLVELDNAQAGHLLTAESTPACVAICAVLLSDKAIWKQQYVSLYILVAVRLMNAKHVSQ